LPLHLDLPSSDLNAGESSVTARLPDGAVCVGITRDDRTGMCTMLLQIPDGMPVVVGGGQKTLDIRCSAPKGRSSGASVRFEADASIPIRRVPRRANGT
jgi:hypothetical protein